MHRCTKNLCRGPSGNIVRRDASRSAAEFETVLPATHEHRVNKATPTGRQSGEFGFVSCTHRVVE